MRTGLGLLLAAGIGAGAFVGLAPGRPVADAVQPLPVLPPPSPPAIESIPRCAAVFVGTVRSATVHRGVGLTGRPRAFTHYEFGDLQVVAGSVATSTIIVPVVGGTLDGATLTVPGMPSFETGGRYLVFYAPLRPMGAVSGGERGAFRVTAGVDGIDRVFTLDGHPAAGFQAGAVVEGNSPVSLGDLVGEIRAIAPAVVVERDR